MHRAIRVLAVAVCLVLAGCGTAPSDESADTVTVTPVPVPGEQVTTGTVTRPSAVGLRPTCERSPGRVVAIQVAALRADDRAAGIATAWAFTAPATRQRIGSVEAFRELLETSYRDLRNATAVEYTPIIVVDGEASRQVRVESTGDDSATFQWVLRRQQSGDYDGCWMTTRITRERDLEAGETP